MKRLFQYFWLALLALVCVSILAWHVVVTRSFVESLINRKLAAITATAQIAGFQRGFFLRAHAKRVSILFQPQVTIPIDDLHVYLQPVTATLPFQGRLFHGNLQGAYALRKRALDLSITGISLEQAIQASKLKFSGQGTLSLQMHDNRITFRAKQLELPDFIQANTIIPLSLVKQAHGTIVTAGDSITVESMILEGFGFQAELKGGLSAKEMNMLVDFVPEDDRLWSQILTKFRVKKKLYRIPLTGKNPFQWK